MRFFNVEMQWYRRGRWQTATHEVFVTHEESAVEYRDFSDKDKNAAAEKAMAALRQAYGDLDDLFVVSVRETRIIDSGETYKIKVTNLNGMWHARLFCNGALEDEMACELQEDIGWICREMLNWSGRMGSANARVESARRRHNKDSGPVGRVIYRNKLVEKARRRE